MWRGRDQRKATLGVDGRERPYEALLALSLDDRRIARRDVDADDMQRAARHGGSLDPCWQVVDEVALARRQPRTAGQVAELAAAYDDLKTRR